MVPVTTCTGDFTPEDVEAIVNLGGSLKLERAKMSGDVYSETRECLVGWIGKQQAPWLFARLAAVLARENRRWYHLDLDGIHGDLQYTVYDPGHHFDWHTDNGGDQDPRKLSFSLLLGDEPGTVGGDLQVFADNPPITLERDAGRLVVFPSFRLHRVTPVEVGCRRSLVGWMSGPHLR